MLPRTLVQCFWMGIILLPLMAGVTPLLGVKILSGLLFLYALASATFILLVKGPSMLAAAFGLGQAAFIAWVGLGLWRLKNWARVLTILASILALAGCVFALVPPLFAVHGPIIVAILLVVLIILCIPVWVIWYLSRPGVKRSFGMTTDVLNE